MYIQYISKKGLELTKLSPGKSKKNYRCIVTELLHFLFLGIKLIGETGVTDITEAKALKHNLKGVDIYSNSWGPHDGYGYNKPGPVTVSALVDGITKVS
jgi:hypothetical protein